jgi:acyl-coenzyme A thioesterase PaaI-like protein
VHVVAAGDGRVHLELPVLPSFVDGSPEGVRALESALAVLCDCGLGLALMERRGDGDGGVTLDLRVDVVGDVLPGTRRLALVAEALHVAEEHGAGRVEVRDDRGRLLAHAAGTMANSASLPFVDRDPVDRRPRRLDLTTVFDGLEVGGAGACVPIRPETENTRGIVHGALLAAAAVAVSRGAGDAGRLLSFGVEFLRPVPADIGELRATIAPVRRGRRFLSDRIVLLLPDGRAAANVTTLFARNG